MEPIEVSVGACDVPVDAHGYVCRAFHGCLFCVMSWLTNRVGFVNVIFFGIIISIIGYLKFDYVHAGQRWFEKKWKKLSDDAIRVLIEKIDGQLEKIVDGFKNPKVHCDHKYVALQKIRDKLYIYVLCHILFMQVVGLSFLPTFLVIFPGVISFQFVRYANPV